MHRRRTPELEAWLAAEAADDDARAETTLAMVFARLPRLAPLPGFADRVMAAAPVAARRVAPAVWAWRWAMAAALVTTGLAVGLVPALRWVPFDLPRFGDVIKTVASATGAVAGWLETGLEAWSFCIQLGRLVAVAIQTPEVAATLAASALVSAVGL
jgi:hypothetical protein